MFLSFRIASCLFLLLALTLSALSKTTTRQSGQQSGVAGTATITGQVKLGGEPAAGVPMALLPEQTGRQPGGRQPNQPPPGTQVPLQPEKTIQTSTDENGIYRFTGVAAGRFRITPLTETSVVTGSDPRGGAGISVSVSEGQTVSQIDFSMARGAVVTGRVTEANNRPVIAERINLMMVTETGQPVPVNGGNRAGLETDDRGVYRAYGLPAGRYLVSAGNDGGNNRQGPGAAFNRRATFARIYHPNATEESEAQVVEVSAGSVAENIDIQLGMPVKAYAVTGRAVDAKTSQPVPGVPINVTRESRNARGGAQPMPGGNNSSTNAEGEFRIAGLMTGRYSASVNPINFSGGAPTTSEFYSKPTSFEIIADDTTGIEVRVHRGASISGVVAIEGATDPAVANRLLQLMVFANSRGGQGQGQRQAPGQGGGATSGGNSLSSVSPNGGSSGGFFRLGGLAPGIFRLNINGGGGPGGGAIKLIRIERNGAPINGDVEVRSGEDVTGVRIVVGYGSAVIQGRVIVSGGALPPGARLLLSARSLNSTTAGAGNNQARIETDGQFRIENLLPGSYELRLTVMTGGGQGPGGGQGRGGQGRVGQQGRGGQGGTPVQPQIKIPEVRQTVTVANGSPASVTLNLNLAQQ